MLLETLDIKKNDVLIYSTNRFDLENSFRIIYKQSPSLKPKPLHFKEVEQYIKNQYPKNLVLYRLLTNLQTFDANFTHYGISLLINNSYELIYYDPVFAIKDLEDLRANIDFNTFRFKIQQIGLTSFGVKQDLYNFSELYSFDLKADEARNQNDKIFADAIFAFSDSYKQENFPVPEKAKLEKKSDLEFKEVHPTPEKRMIKISAQNLNLSVRKSGQNIYIPLSELSIPPVAQKKEVPPQEESKKSLNEFLHSQKQINNSIQDQSETVREDSGILNMFKSAKNSRTSEEHIFKAEHKGEE